MRQRCMAVVLIAVGITLLASAAALAWKEGGADADIDGLDCDVCHTEAWPPFDTRQGPHQGYSVTTNKCSVCHQVHEAAGGGVKLLPRATIKATCEMCHDGTGGYGVYGAITARGLTVGATHRIDTTNTVPGGDAATGGSATITFGGESDNLSCHDCHSPHDANTVDPFRGERIRFHADELNYGAPTKDWSTSHLLRQQPAGATTASAEYGSDWCAGCHKGRPSGGSVMNHPVDSSATHASPFYYDYVAILTTETSLLTTMGTMGLIGTSTPDLEWHNRGFVMPEPRTADQSGHSPICQQCHEDAREVGDPGSVNQARVWRYGDGVKEDASTPTDVPLFQTFPHEGQNSYFLVERYDTLCTNCHSVTSLP